MAQLNITLNQDEVLQLLADNSGNAFRVLLQNTLNSVLKAESAEQLHVQPYERSEKRTDSRNGTRTRALTTRIGTIDLVVPRHRNVPFKTLVFENYKRSEAALITTMAEMVVAGVSTAKVSRVMEEICGKSFSKQTVSQACQELDIAVDEFQTRPLDKIYPFVMADATYIKVRQNHRVQACALLVAIGLDSYGKKEIIGFDVAESETYESWKEFFLTLQNRNLYGTKMITSDAHEGLVHAAQDIFPNIPWQRCQAHFSRNIADAAPKKFRVGLRSELTEMFNCKSIEDARNRRDEIIADYKECAPKAIERLDAGFDDAMTVMELPEKLRQCTRTSNILERLNKEIKRRSNVIGVFPNTASLRRLIGAVLMEENERWAAKHRMYFTSSYEQLADVEPKLIEVAKLQRKLRVVA